MVYEFLRWWMWQAADCVPPQWRPLGMATAGAVVVTPSGPVSRPVEGVAISLRRGQQESSVGDFRLDAGTLAAIPDIAARPAVLRLRKEDVLAATLVLPLAVEHQLDQALAFEMDRETPFTPEEVFWTWRVERRDRQSKQLWVRLLLVPRTRLERLLEVLHQADIMPGRVEIATGPDRDGRISLDAVNGDIRRHRLLRPAVAVCIVLAVAAVLVPFVRQAAQLAALEHQLAADHPAAAEALKLRAEIDRLTRDTDLIEVERDRAGRPLAVLAAVTRLLPADAYLTDFTQQQGKVTLTGRSPAASRLIAGLAAATQLRNPNFTAPITRLAASQTELFTITAEVVP